MSQSDDHSPASEPHTVSFENSERFLTVLHSLENEIKRQTSLRHALLRGMVYGLGTVIGATLLLAVFGGILASFISSLGGLPVVGELIDAHAVERYLNEPATESAF